MKRIPWAFSPSVKRIKMTKLKLKQASIILKQEFKGNVISNSKYFSYKLLTWWVKQERARLNKWFIHFGWFCTHSWCETQQRMTEWTTYRCQDYMQGNIRMVWLRIRMKMKQSTPLTNIPKEEATRNRNQSVLAGSSNGAALNHSLHLSGTWRSGLCLCKKKGIFLCTIPFISAHI